MSGRYHSTKVQIRMFGVPVEGPTDIFCDNMSPVKNCSCVELKLTKKHNSLAYYAVRWAVAAKIIRLAWIDEKFNLADAMAKLLSAPKRGNLFDNWTY